MVWGKKIQLGMSFKNKKIKNKKLKYQLQSTISIPMEKQRERLLCKSLQKESLLRVDERTWVQIENYRRCCLEKFLDNQQVFAMINFFDIKKINTEKWVLFSKKNIAKWNKQTINLSFGRVPPSPYSTSNRVKRWTVVRGDKRKISQTSSCA